MCYFSYVVCFADSVLDRGNLVFFFFKQKTAYELRISDWSSDVCSSDLGVDALEIVGKIIVVEFGRIERRQQDRGDAEPLQIIEAVGDALKVAVTGDPGRTLP